ncbi:MAG: CBASS cGAMP-activated phospholipase [Phycisphaerae bacterium]|jgi:patatin-like phospholipase/acyl hydrolase
MSTDNDNIKPFRVLTLDGGGMRGLYTASLLETLGQRFAPKFKSKEVQPDIGKSFDLICGTSTGAILACALAAGIPIYKICDLYKVKGQEIFPSPVPLKCFGLWLFKHLKKPSANSKILQETLSDCFKKMTLKELYERRNIRLCIPTINASTHKAWVFKTGHNAGKNRDDNYKLIDVCLASAAAPIFFPINGQSNPDNSSQKQYFVDGGLWANNPVLTGLIEALAITDVSKQPIELISIGTCDKPTGDPYAIDDCNRGLLSWKAGIKIIELSLSAQAYGYSNMAKFLAQSISKRGQRVITIRLESSEKSPEHYSSIGLDRADNSAIQTLLGFASADADHIHSKVLNNEHYGSDEIKNIFSNLSELSV